MIAWTLYDTTSGEILAVGSAPDEATANLQATTAGTAVLLEESTLGADRVDVSGTPTLAARTAMHVGGVPTAASATTIDIDGVDTVTITPVPVGATLRIALPDDVGIDPIAAQTVNDGSVVLTTNVAGSYVVTLSSFPLADFTVTINAS
jgi:hypothetical protein